MMKIKLIVLTGMLAVLMLFTVNAEAQVVVKIKPSRPVKVLVKPAKAKKNHLWLDGHWRWNKATNSYSWIKGHYIKKRKGYHHVPGHWVALKGGYNWISPIWKKL